MPYSLNSSSRVVWGSMIMSVWYMIGALSTLFLGVPSSVGSNLGDYWDIVWATTLIVGPIISTIGLFLGDQWAGTWARVGGNMMTTGGLIITWISVSNLYGALNFYACLLFGLATASVLWLVTDVRHLLHIHRMASIIEQTRDEK